MKKALDNALKMEKNYRKFFNDMNLKAHNGHGRFVQPGDNHDFYYCRNAPALYPGSCGKRITLVK